MPLDNIMGKLKETDTSRTEASIQVDGCVGGHL